MEKENKKSLSCRKVFIRHLRIFVSDGMVNEREEIRRSRITNFRDDRSLFNNGNAFTLIELLVVVLIIGILAAVAVPQYTTAVEKSRATQALTLLKSVAEAQQAYYLANGTYAQSFDELAVDIPWSGHTPWIDTAKDTRSNGDWTLQLFDYDGVAVYIGRLSGKYKGAGFSKWLKSNHGVEEGGVRCMERPGPFQANPGDYCVKVMKGTYEFTSGARSYKLQQ